MQISEISFKNICASKGQNEYAVKTAVSFATKSDGNLISEEIQSRVNQEMFKETTKESNFF